jgi:tripartite-type tricarboxylate transporter receptor subunit TctC
MVPQLQSGRLTALAVNSRQRSPLFPEVPTLAEARPSGGDYPPTWFGLFTQTGVPRPIADKIAADVSRVIAQPAFRQRMYVERAVEPVTETLDEFARFVRTERKIAERIVKESGEEPR